MDKKLQLYFKLNGLDPNEKRFSDVVDRSSLGSSLILPWADQIEGYEFWFSFYSRFNDFKAPKNNKLNQKLYPDFQDLLL